MNHRYIYILLILFSFSGLSDAQEAIYAYDHIGPVDGLTGQICKVINEDDSGSIWIASYDEVSVYDGNSVKTFNSYNSILRPWIIYDLFKDGNGLIWVIQGKVINDPKVYNIPSLIFHITVINPEGNEFQDITTIINKEKLDIKNLAYIDQIGTSGIKLVTEDGRLYNYKESLSFIADGINLKTFHYVDENNNTFHKMSHSTLSVRDLSEQKRIDIDISNWEIASKTIPFDTKFMISCQDGPIIEKYCYSDGQVQKIYGEGTENTLAGRVFQFEIKSLEDCLTLNGERLINHKEKLYSIPENDIFSFNPEIDRKVINCVYKSKNQLIFIGTNLGVFVIEPQKMLFNKFQSLENGTNSVRAIHMDENIQAYHYVTNKEKITSSNGTYDIDFLENEDLGNLATSHYIDPLNEHTMWSTGYLGTTYRKINFQERKVTYPKKLGPKLKIGFFRSPVTQRLYTYGEDGIFIANEEENKFKKVDAYFNHFDSTSIEVYDVKFYDEKILLGTSRGIRFYDELENKIVDLPECYEMITDQIDYIHLDKDNKNIFWLATMRNGVIKYDHQNLSINYLDTEKGLSHDTPHFIHEDVYGRLWIPTNKYLNCYDKTTGSNRVFTEDHGIPHSEFNRRSYYYNNSEGKLWLGGLNGYIHFKPDSIILDDKKKINVKIVSAEIIEESGNHRDVFKNLLREKNIAYEKQDVILKLGLSTDYLYKTKLNSYSYRILGLDDKWNTLREKELFLSRLPYGEYELEIVSELGNRQKQSDILKIRINIQRPFNKSPLFYVLSIMVLSLLVWLSTRYRLQSIEARNAELENTVSERTSELQKSNEVKKKIFTILAHDLRNPMSSLTDINDKIQFLIRNNRFNEIDELTKTTNEKINALDDNLTNILHWALNESDLIPNTKEKLSIKLELEKILKLYSSQVESKNLFVKMNLDLIDQVHMNPAILQTILRNILSNAIKYSLNGGKITISKTDETATRISYSIADEGHGIGNDNTAIKQYEELDRTGIGLKIVNDLCQKSNSKIKFSSSPMEGTTVMLEFPKV